jgi:hypothetical protein
MTFVLLIPLKEEMSTEGKVSPLTIVMPLVDKDWDMDKGAPSPELSERGEEGDEEGILGRLKHP